MYGRLNAPSSEGRFFSIVQNVRFDSRRISMAATVLTENTNPSILGHREQPRFQAHWNELLRQGRMIYGLYCYFSILIQPATASCMAASLG